MNGTPLLFKISVILVGTKIGLVAKRQVESAEATEFVKAHQMIAVEVSAKEDILIDQTFTTLMEIVVQRLSQNVPPPMLEEERTRQLKLFDSKSNKEKGDTCIDRCAIV